jgi:hypothetical protein
MLIIYRDGEVRNQIVAWGGDRERRIEGAFCVFYLPKLLKLSQNWRQYLSCAVP